jgi:hypothetical protein|tara:strand:- start:1252 stop:1452 length:201 start_codon:yes stop_codon:yes gene_type:complete
MPPHNEDAINAINAGSEELQKASAGYGKTSIKHRNLAIKHYERAKDSLDILISRVNMSIARIKKSL